ncbi:Peptidyl-prolyl cis-trans isomerase cyp6 [Nowakowskiella sp. JEL0407]|nr:Peptidyl-prolyl cis-trans isomerase cyp6 [Nowakowskiella sp. JEL0407]
MSVLLETRLGDIIIDLYTKKCPTASSNFIKLCKLKKYNFLKFSKIERNFILTLQNQIDNVPGGKCINAYTNEQAAPYFQPEIHPKLAHDKKGIVSYVSVTTETGVFAGAQFFITLTDQHLEYLDGKHAVFGRVMEGLDVLDKINDEMVDESGCPFVDLRIKHTIILDDPFPSPPIRFPSRSPSPPPDLLSTTYLTEQDLTQITSMSAAELEAYHASLESQRLKDEAAARALTLEMVGDLPFAEIRPPENILFVCKLNAVTREEDLEIIFGRFGKIHSCEVIRDKKTGQSLNYAFIDFETREACEEAYFKMDNVLIDDRRIHVDFSQSVSKYIGPNNVIKADAMQKIMSGRGKRDEYEMVFEHDGETLDAEKKRQRRAGGGQRSEISDRDRKDDYKRRDDDRYRRGGGGKYGDHERRKDEDWRRRESKDSRDYGRERDRGDYKRSKYERDDRRDE